MKKHVNQVIIMLKPINRSSISAQIYEQLLNNIVSGEWPVGMKLPTEKELTEQFHVSRAPIREALQRLRALGVLESHQGSGSFVSDNSPLEAMETILSCNTVTKQQIVELLEFRKIFEPYCVQKVAEIATNQQLFELEKYAPSHDTIKARADIRTLTFEMDVAFHRDIVFLTNNTLFISMYEVISNLRLKHISFFVGIRMDHERILEEHRDIYQALICRDAKLASELMYKHLVYVSDLM